MYLYASLRGECEISGCEMVDEPCMRKNILENWQIKQLFTHVLMVTFLYGLQKSYWDQINLPQVKFKCGDC